MATSLGPELASYKARIERLIKISKSELDPFDELQSHLSRYICVLTSGLLEVAVRSVLSRYSAAKAAPRLLSYIERDLAQFQNPKMNKIIDLLGKFDLDWAEKVKAATEGELKDAVDSVVANRHLIAHGSNVGISIKTMESYYCRVVKVIDIIADVCT